MADHRWTIDVCRTCGRQAKWPFCEHRPEAHKAGSWLSSEPSWCVAIAVKPCYPAQADKLLGAS